MEEPELIDLRPEEEVKEDFFYIEKPTKDEKYFSDTSKCLNLLSACVVVPNGEGTAELNYLIKEPVHRIELENYAMNLIRKNLHSIIKVNEEGFNPRKRKM